MSSSVFIALLGVLLIGLTGVSCALQAAIDKKSDSGSAPKSLAVSYPRIQSHAPEKHHVVSRISFDSRPAMLSGSSLLNKDTIPDEIASVQDQLDTLQADLDAASASQQRSEDIMGRLPSLSNLSAIGWLGTSATLAPILNATNISDSNSSSINDTETGLSFVKFYSFEVNNQTKEGNVTSVADSFVQRHFYLVSFIAVWVVLIFVSSMLSFLLSLRPTESL